MSGRARDAYLSLMALVFQLYWLSWRRGEGFSLRLTQPVRRWVCLPCSSSPERYVCAQLASIHGILGMLPTLPLVVGALPLHGP